MRAAEVRHNPNRFLALSTPLKDIVHANCGRVLGLLEKMASGTSGGKYQAKGVDVLEVFWSQDLSWDLRKRFSGGVFRCLGMFIFPFSADV